MDLKIISFAIEAHQRTNHLYDGNPYSVHLELVVYFVQNKPALPDKHKAGSKC
jgi:hypothetical protein